MASTRNINTRENYKIQQRNFESFLNYELYENSQTGAAYSPALPVLGFNPSHLSRNDLAYNPIEIESSLFGINSTNLVNPQPAVNPQLKTLPEKSFFKTVPLVMPIPMAIEKKQRPFPI
tara:strand:- start:1672 stop:2028 length:357 start_codon:yes stop_codon:yes gene_type:complete